MKKFLSILLTVTMIFSLVAAFRVPTASAAPSVATLTSGTTLSATTVLPYYNPTPTFGTPASGTPLTIIAGKLFKMGDIITGYLNEAPTAPWQVILEETGGADVETVNMAGGSVNFSISTGNVSRDGDYRLHFVGTGFDFYVAGIYIQYNIVFSASTLQTCGTSQTISGWITRGSGQTVLVPVNVFVAYPDHSLAGYTTIPANSSGQFTITFPSDGPDVDTLPDIGSFRVYVRDGYGTAENDAMIYKVLSNVPTLSMTLSTYVNPVFIYKNQAAQPVLLHLVNQDGDPVTGLAQTDWTVTGATVTGYNEISPGFYRFLLSVGNVVDVRFTATQTVYGTSVPSNTLVINTRDKGVYNPYVDVTAIYAIPPYGSGPTTYLAQNVYDKLPCTIGNAFEVTADYWLPIDPDNWYIYDFSYTVKSFVTENGEPVENKFGIKNIGTDRYLVTGNGTITVDVSFVAWERANKDCDDWWIYTGANNGWAWDYIDEETMAYNACCDTWSKQFTICEVNSCDIASVTLSGGNEIDAKTVEVGKKVNVGISPKQQGITTEEYDLSCSCPYDVVWMYMVDGNGNKVPSAFTIDTWPLGTTTVTDIWYNPNNAAGTGIPDLPITFQPTTVPEAVDCPFNLRGVTFNYPTGTDCGYTLVVKMFGRHRDYNACNEIITTWPMIGEQINPITVLPSVTKLTATGEIWEGQTDPDEILAGIATVIDITNPGFTLGTPNWEFYLNGVAVSGVGVSSLPDGGYRFSGICLDDEGTFEIYGYAYGTGCTKKEEITLTFTVRKPEFTVKIGLLDGSVIDNDNILTTGFPEVVYVTPVDPRGVHDFTNDTWSLYAEEVLNDCDLPVASICTYGVAGDCCGGHGGLQIVGYDNPCLEDAPLVDLYFVSPCGAYIYVDTFTLVPPTIKVTLEDIYGNEIEKAPVTVPPTNTHVIFNVKDAHGHGAPDVEVEVTFGGISGSAQGYTSIDLPNGITNNDGEADWIYPFTKSGRYYVWADMGEYCDYPCGWYGINTEEYFEAIYVAPVLDTTAPVVDVTAPADGAEVSTAVVTVSGKVTDDVGVVSLQIGATRVDFAPDGAFTAKVDLVEGENIIKVVAFDAAGNKGEKDITVTYTAPKVTVVKVQIGSDIMTVNGKAVQIDAPAEIVNGRTFLPLRAISEALGATVEWIPDTQGVTVILGENTIGLQIGNTSAVVNGVIMILDAAPYIKNDRTMVPFRLIAEGLGATVEWDPGLRIVTVTLAQ